MVLGIVDRMECPHCFVTIHAGWKTCGRFARRVEPPIFETQCALCPQCDQYIVSIVYGSNPHEFTRDELEAREVIYPRTSPRRPPPAEVPDPYAQDYREACLVAAVSPKASAALSRRCLQMVLRDKASVRPGTLHAEIAEVTPYLPPYLARSLDAVRVVGNFAAHPIKDTDAGMVTEVEPGEAEWLLDVIESLFEFYFVAPATLDTKRAALNAKLSAAGKPLLND